MHKHDRFKFRAWDGHQMWHPDDQRTDVVALHFRQDGLLHQVNVGSKDYDWDVVGYSFYDGPKPNKPVLTLMQCTGLVDCQGKLMYEGDYVRIKRWGNPRTDDQNYVALIEWHNDGFSYRQKFQSGGSSNSFGLDFKSMYHPQNTIEVIGNIYESEDRLITEFAISKVA